MPVNDDSKANAQSGAIKVDVGSSSRDVVGRLSFGYRCFGGELIFVPRQQNPAALQGRLASRPGLEICEQAALNPELYTLNPGCLGDV